MKSFWSVFLILFSVVLFCYYEFLTFVVLESVSLDVYFISRFVVGALFTLYLMRVFSRRYRDAVDAWNANKPAEQRAQPRAASYLQYLLSLDALHRLLLITNAICWSFSTIFLSFAFALSNSLVAAYIFFLVHPLWTLVLRVATRPFTGAVASPQHPRILLAEILFPVKTLVSVAFMILGTIIFLIGAKVAMPDSTATLGDAPSVVWKSLIAALADQLSVYLFAALGGFAFGLGNYTVELIGNIEKSVDRFPGRANDVKDFELARERGIYKQYMMLSRYLAGLVGGYLAMVLVKSYSTTRGPLHLEQGQSKMAILYQTYPFLDVKVGSGNMNLSVVILLVLIGVISCFANYLFAKMISDTNSALVTGIELLTVPIALGLIWIHGFPESLATPFLAWTGILIQIVAAFLIHRYTSPDSGIVKARVSLAQPQPL